MAGLAKIAQRLGPEAAAGVGQTVDRAAIARKVMDDIDHGSLGAPPVPPAIKAGIREAFRGALILAGGYDRERAEADLAAHRGDLVAFGRPFLGNPHLVAKLRDGAPLHAANPATFFSPGDEGYVDVPVD